MSLLPHILAATMLSQRGTRRASGQLMENSNNGDRAGGFAMNHVQHTTGVGLLHRNRRQHTVRVHTNSSYASLSFNNGPPRSATPSANLLGQGIVPEQRIMAQQPHQVPTEIGPSPYSPQVDQHSTEHLTLPEEFSPGSYPSQPSVAYQSVWDTQYQPNSSPPSPETPINPMDAYPGQTGQFPAEAGTRASTENPANSSYNASSQAGAFSYPHSTPSAEWEQSAAMAEAMSSSDPEQREPLFDEAQHPFGRPAPSSYFHPFVLAQAPPPDPFRGPGSRTTMSRPYADNGFPHGGNPYNRPPIFRPGWPGSSGSGSGINAPYVPEYSRRDMFTGKLFEDMAPRGQKRCAEFREEYARSAKRNRFDFGFDGPAPPRERYDYARFLDHGFDHKREYFRCLGLGLGLNYAHAHDHAGVPNHGSSSSGYRTDSGARRQWAPRGNTTTEVEIYDILAPGVETLLLAPGAGDGTTTSGATTSTTSTTTTTADAVKVTTTTFVVIGGRTIEVLDGSDDDDE